MYDDDMAELEEILRKCKSLMCAHLGWWVTYDLGKMGAITGGSWDDVTIENQEEDVTYASLLVSLTPHGKRVGNLNDFVGVAYTAGWSCRLIHIKCEEGSKLNFRVERLNRKLQSVSKVIADTSNLMEGIKSLVGV